MERENFTHTHTKTSRPKKTNANQDTGMHLFADASADGIDRVQNNYEPVSDSDTNEQVQLRIFPQ